MIIPVAPIYKTVYNTYSIPNQKRIVKEVKEHQKDLKSTGQLINIKV